MTAGGSQRRAKRVPPYLLHNVKEQFEMMRVRQHIDALRGGA